MVSFQTATYYNSSLVLSKLDPALVKAAYNIAVLNLTETLWFPFMLCYWCWKKCGPVYHGFQLMPRPRSTRYLFSIKATNKLKSKVLKNNTINGKNFTIIWWMVNNNKWNTISGTKMQQSSRSCWIVENFLHWDWTKA